MVKPGALLLLLAVAASQVDLSLSQSTTITDTGEVDITDCPLFFYGVEYTLLSVTVNDDASVNICFINNPGETSQDCLLFPNGGNRVTVTVFASSQGTVPILPDQTSSCSVFLELTAADVEDFTLDLDFYKFDQQTALLIFASESFSAANVVVSATVDNSTVDSWNWTKAEARNVVYTELSGCRHSGSGFAADSVIKTGEMCSNLMCDASAVVKTVSSCGTFEVCNSNNTCVPDPVVCTVTGSSVIDVFGRVHTVQDQCAYSLMKTNESSEFDLIAVFRERRRKDVSLLDHMIIFLFGPGVKIHLGQSGRVLVDEQTLELNATAQLVHGVELSKDQTGVTAKLPPSFSNMTVFFDGNTAHVSGIYEVVTGLCGFTPDPNVTIILSDEKIRPFSALGCETQHSDDPDSTIDCTLATERCNLLNQAPFTACHDRIDPEPFITACTNTSCQYPMVDGLNCQFLEAYADSCFLEDITLEWRSQTGCPVRQAFCPQYCSDHEFCGENLGESHCLCRATFASMYKPTDSLGDPTVCMESSATLTLAECLLAEKGIDSSTLHLNDPDCKGDKDEETHMVTFSFNSSNTCGTEVMNNSSQLMYMNTITTGNSSGVINRDSEVNIDFSCYYTEPEDVQSVSFKIKDSSVVKEIVSGVWNYTLWMNAYTDSGLVNLVGLDTEILLNQPVWVEMKTEGLDENMVAIVTDSCWATSQPLSTSTPRYDLVTDGCANSADLTVSVEGNGLGTYNTVSFRMFEFPGQTDEVYLHCEVELCPTLGQSCAPTCGGGGLRKRRAFRTKYADENAALITMAWNN